MSELDIYEPMDLTQLALKKLAQALQSIGSDKIIVALYGYDGTNWQPVKVTSDGKVVGVLQ